MNPRHMLSASLLLAVAQAGSLHPASTVPLESFNNLMALSRSPRFGNERTLYSGFQPPMSYEAENDVVASARSLGESNHTNHVRVSFLSCEQLSTFSALLISKQRQSHWRLESCLEGSPRFGNERSLYTGSSHQ